MKRKLRHFEIYRPLGIAILILMAVIASAIPYRIYDLRSRAAPIPANIVVYADSTKATEFSGSYLRAFAQGGEEKRDLLQPAQDKISALNPEIIRVDHIFDYFVTVTRSESGFRYDFTALDDVVRSIIKTGATPLLSLGYMLPELSENGSVVGKPKNWAEWSDLVKQTVSRYSGKAAMNLSGVYYEVWNEPDLEQFGLWKTYGGKNYLDLYQAAVAGVQLAQNTNQYYLGGPAISKFYTAWIEAIIKSGLRVDFFSWHSYSLDPGETHFDIQKFRELVSGDSRYKNAQILITENGFSSSKDKRYATDFAAVYSASLFRQLADDPPVYIIAFELVDGPNDTDSGWGLLTHDSKGLIPKPRYRFFRRIADFQGARLPVVGEGSAVKCLAIKNGEEVRLLITNYQFDRDNTEETPVKIIGLRDGDYQIEKQFFSGNNLVSNIRVQNTTVEFTVLMPNKSAVWVNIKNK